MIEYKSTKQNTELPEIQGYKKQFSINIPRGDEEKTEDIQKPEVQQEIQQPQQTAVQQQVPTQQPTSEWSDIKSIIKKNEGFVSSAKNFFNEPNASIGYGFFGSLPDGRKIYSGMAITREEADKQLDIAINKLSSQVKNYLSQYNIQTSPEQFNVLLDLGYHGGVGLVGKLLKESDGDASKIGSLLTRYATTAKYGDTSISKALKDRALRRSQGWNSHPLKGQNGLKVPPAGEIKQYRPQNPIGLGEQIDRKLSNNQTYSQLKRGFKNFNNSALGKVFNLVIPKNLQEGMMSITPIFKESELINMHDWEGLELLPTKNHFGLNGRAIEPNPTTIVPNNPTAGPYKGKIKSPEFIKPGRTQNMQRHENLENLDKKFKGDREKLYKWLSEHKTKANSK